MTLFGGAILYLALLGMAAGVASLVKPLRFLGIRTRKRGAAVLGLSLVAFVAGVYLPVTETRVETPRTRLDEFVPVYQFSEFHSVDIAASKERVDAAIRAVRPEEIRFLKTLMGIRGIGNMAPEGRPILESFITKSFMPLADEPGREIVFGQGGSAPGGRRRRLTAGDFKAFPPGPLAKIAMNFRIQELDATHCILTTETRVYTAGPHVLRGFATYWRMIYPGSALIRREWLRAIQRRAEAAQVSVRAPG
jgi:hypothetical protein